MRRRLGPLLTAFITVAVAVSCGSTPPPASPTLTAAPTAAPSTGTAPTASPLAGDDSVAAVEVAPGGVLLSGSGESKTLTAVANTADGQAVDATVSWTSSDPAIVSVDADGLVRAVAAVGTALITASVDDIQSPPAYVTVAQPVPGALLINDSQIVDGPSIVDTAAEPSADNAYEVVLRGVADLAPGSILINTEAVSVAGRVVSTEPEGDDQRVRLVVVPPTELFTDFEFKDSVDLSVGPFEIPAELAALYDVQQTDSTFVFTPKAASAHSTDVVLASMIVGGESLAPPPVADGAAQGTTALSPLPPFNNCKATIGFGSGLPVPLALSAPPSFTWTADGEVLREATPQGTTYIVRATPTFKFTSVLEIRSAFEAKVECKVTLFKKPFRAPGWAGVIFGGDVEFGVGFEVGGKVTLFSAKVGGSAEVTPTFEASLSCPSGGDCALSGDVTATTAITPILDAPSLDQAQFEPTVSLFGFVALDAGNADIPPFQFRAIEFKAGLELGAGLALEALQMTNTNPDNGRSKYALAFKGEVGPGIGLGEFLAYVGLSEVVPLKLSFEVPLGESPTGTVSADRARYLPGERATVTVTLVAASTLFPNGGLYNVDRVVVLRKTGLATTEVLAEQPATEGQTEFTLAFDAPGLLNADELFAFVSTVLLDPPKLEIGAAETFGAIPGTSSARIRVLAGTSGNPAGTHRIDAPEGFTTFAPSPLSAHSVAGGAQASAMGSQMTSIISAGGYLESVTSLASITASQTTTPSDNGFADSESWFRLPFEVTGQPLHFTVSGNLTSLCVGNPADCSAGVRVMLRPASGNTTVFTSVVGNVSDFGDGPSSDSLMEEGTLQPGSYELFLQAMVSADSDEEAGETGSVESSASWDITMTFGSTTLP